MSTLLKKLIPTSVKQRLKPHYIKAMNNYHYRNLRSLRDEQKIILFGTPEHDNLGDHAIAYAIHKFLRDHLPDYNIIEVPTYEYKLYAEALQKCVKPGDIIALSGGGNFGDEYIDEENLRRSVISTFKNNKVILFPQTIFFSKSEKGASEFAQSRNIYSQHDQLTMVAREAFSYEILKEHFPNNQVLLTPDIVLYLHEEDAKVERQGALICLRDDIESVTPPEQIRKIKELFQKTFDSVTVTDTVISRPVAKEKREMELRQKWDEFRKAEIVITDRLHGMVFAAITGTPCIVLSNYNYKVKGTYDWIKHLDYIIFTENPDEIPNHMEQLLKKNSDYKYSLTYEYYKPIIDEMVKV